MNALKKNYNLSLWLTRIAFVVCYIFGHWFNLKSFSVALFGDLTNLSVDVYASVWFVLLYGVVSAVIMLLIVRLLTVWILRYTGTHYLPVNETILFVILFAALKNLIAGVLYLTYWITPVAAGWGGILYDFIALLIASLSFYFFMDKHYVPDGNRAGFFKTVFTLVTLYAVIQLVFGVLNLL